MMRSCPKLIPVSCLIRSVFVIMCFCRALSVLCSPFLVPLKHKNIVSINRTKQQTTKQTHTHTKWKNQDLSWVVCVFFFFHTLFMVHPQHYIRSLNQRSKLTEKLSLICPVVLKTVSGMLICLWILEVPEVLQRSGRLIATILSAFRLCLTVIWNVAV